MNDWVMTVVLHDPFTLVAFSVGVAALCMLVVVVPSLFLEEWYKKRKERHGMEQTRTAKRVYPPI